LEAAFSYKLPWADLILIRLCPQRSLKYALNLRSISYKKKGKIGNVMDNNDVLRRFRYALNIADATMVKIFNMGHCNVALSGVNALLKKEDQPGFMACGDDAMRSFLDGLITYNRGPREGNSPASLPKPQLLNNNIILKKLKIALELRQDDLIDIFGLAGVSVSKGEITALFRKQGHKNYRPCQDQFLRNFLKGLALRHRR